MPVVSLRRRSEAAELLDGPLLAHGDLGGNLRDLARINRWTGGDALVHLALRRLLAGRAERAFSLLDVGGGGGDGIARAVRWAGRHQFRCRGILLDRSAPILQLAGSRHRPGVQRICGDGCRLPLRDRSVDIASCSLVLHHCTAAQARTLVAEMARVARLGIILDDLLRSHLGLAGARLLGALLTRNRLTRHDGPLSVQRAFTARELAAILVGAGLRSDWQVTLPGYRTVIVARPAVAVRA
jgi:SAM-dependent methyltransferase